LAKCQRYRYQIDLGDESAPQHYLMSRFEASAGPAYAFVPFPAEMRIAPNFTYTGGTASSSGYAGNPSMNRSTPSGANLISSRNISANFTVYLRPTALPSSGILILNFDAEL